MKKMIIFAQLICYILFLLFINSISLDAIILGSIAIGFIALLLLMKYGFNIFIFQKNIKYISVLVFLCLIITAIYKLIGNYSYLACINSILMFVLIAEIYWFVSRRSSAYRGYIILNLVSGLGIWSLLAGYNYIFIPMPLVYGLYMLYESVSKKKTKALVLVYLLGIVLASISLFKTNSDVFESNLILFRIGVCYYIVSFIYKAIVGRSETNKMDIISFALLLGMFITKHYEYIYVVVPFMVTDLIINIKYKITGIKRKISSNRVKVSAVIPNYNYANYLEDRINSIISQTVLVDEIVILDDCSSDNSDEVIKKSIKELNKLDIKTKYVNNKKNSGSVFEQWKKGIAEATNDLIWICEADDLCNEHFLENVLLPFEEKDVILSYSESAIINPNNVILFDDYRCWNNLEDGNRSVSKYVVDGKTEIVKHLYNNCCINNVSGVVFKKDKKIDFDKILNGSKQYKLSGDWYFYFKICQYGKVAYNPYSLNYHRVHDNSVTNTTSRSVVNEETEEIQEMIKKYLGGV